MCNPALNSNKNISKAMKMYVASSAVSSNIEPKNPIVSDVRETGRLSEWKAGPSQVSGDLSSHDFSFNNDCTFKSISI